jgi:hypothetical protein
MSSYTPDICPHTESYRFHHLVEETVPGFRACINERIVTGYEKLSTTQKKGFLTCLYFLTSNILPDAYLRNRDIWLVQRQIEIGLRNCLDFEKEES